MKNTFEKMIVAARELSKGTILRESDLAYKKPMDGIPASKYKLVIGQKLQQDLLKDMPIIMDLNE